MNKKRGIILAVLIVFVGAGWTYWKSIQPDPQVLAVKALIPDDISKIPEEKRRETFQKIREETSKLSPEQRSEVFKDRKEKMINRLREYNKLPKEEQVAFLDKEIERMDNMMKNWQKGAQNRPKRTNDQNRSGNREDRKRNRLDSTTPEERALFMNFIQDIQARRNELGLPPVGPPGFRGRG